jgi:hypothetical protein
VQKLLIFPTPVAHCPKPFTVLITHIRAEHVDGGDGNWKTTTLAYFGYLVHEDVFQEVTLCR